MLYSHFFWASICLEGELSRIYSKLAHRRAGSDLSNISGCSGLKAREGCGGIRLKKLQVCISFYLFKQDLKKPNRVTFKTPSPFPPSSLQYLVVMTTPHSRCWVLLQMAAVNGKSVTQQGDEATGRCDGVTAWQCRLQHRCATRKPSLCTHGTPLPGNGWEILSSSALWSWSDVKTGRSPFRHANAPIITHVKVLCFHCERPSWWITLKSIWRKGFGAKVKLRSPDRAQCVWSAVFQNKIPRV